MTDEELQEMIDEADRDGDGEVNEEARLPSAVHAPLGGAHCSLSAPPQEFIRIMRKTALARALRRARLKLQTLVADASPPRASLCARSSRRTTLAASLAGLPPLRLPACPRTHARCTARKACSYDSLCVHRAPRSSRANAVHCSACIAVAMARARARYVLTCVPSTHVMLWAGPACSRDDTSAAAHPRAALRRACEGGVRSRPLRRSAMLQSEAAPGAALSLPAALLTKRTRCDSPGTAGDAPAADGFAADDTGAPAQGAADGDCTGEREAPQASSPLRGGVSPIRAANKSPRWRAPHGQGSNEPGSPLAPRQLIVSVSAGAPAAANATPASDADAAPAAQGDASPPHVEVGSDLEAEQQAER